ncbi:DUF1259 domain-containing protein [Bacillus sp. NPDC077411]|uniref:DUF1259 domain-containing protein n=1 Tax=Bacillus bruguierae TaxID=3127667 RepID=A0ABU8FGD2_9BACI|nr:MULTISPECIES: DUF1259 domain-containing protein [unclassified Bacillus (in: firmicutes)]SFI28192.1 protein of unknown function [Bacillus sp. 71mf]SFS39576.1 protein of unknown function [Bacillus sp. 103mf]
MSSNSCHSNDSKSNLCNEFARILNGSGMVTPEGVCLVQKFRNIRFTILGRRTKSPLVNPQFFSFEDVDRNGNALNLGETVLLQEEVNPLLTELRKRNIIVTALHNHWLFEEPRAMYMHFESIEPPLEFARKIREAFKVLKA